MNLNTVHKFTMGTSLVMGLFYALWSGYRFFTQGGARYAVAAGLALLASAGMWLYLRQFVARTKQIPRSDSATADKPSPET